MSAPAWLVAIGLLAVVLAFVSVGLLPHPYGGILGAVLSGAGVWAVGRAEGLHKRRKSQPPS